MRSGDGWTTCGQGHRHWGLFGAAGLALRSDRPEPSLVLQHRADWSHHGDTWGIPGGARDEGESAIEAALREVEEETTLDRTQVRVEWQWRDDHGGWSYTVVGASPLVDDLAPAPHGPESTALDWVALDATDRMALHPGFAATWPLVRTFGPAPVLVVDAANTIGSRPDGWWRDRAGAVVRLRDQLVAGSAAGLVLPGAPDVISHPVVVLVTEGAARAVEAVDGVRVRAAPGSGDDAIVAEVAEVSGAGRPVVVVTADRELRSRVTALGAQTIGPRTLLDALPPAPAA